MFYDTLNFRSSHSQVLFSRSAAYLSLLVHKIQHTAQDGQQQDADNDDRNDNTAALWWGEKGTQTTRALQSVAETV